MNARNIKSATLLILCFLTAPATFAQTTSFNFQGRLNDGANAANGRYDFQFKLFDAITGGNQIGAMADRPNTALINGIFSTTLDFGAAAFADANRFLEISVRPNGSPNPHVILGARQQILSVPFAVRAISAAQADNATNAQNAVNATNAVNSQNAVSATSATNATNAVTAQNSLSLGGTAASEYVRRNVVNTGNLNMSGNLEISGDVTQANGARGFMKAMIYVGTGGQIFRCYNGVTGNSTGNCGYTVTEPLGNVGVYRIDFGFPVSNRFVQITPEYSVIGALNKGANFKFNGIFLEVFTFAAGNSDDTARANFMVFLY